MSAAVHTDLRVLTSTLVVSSLIGLVYYLNILIVMTLKPGVANSRGGSTPVSMPGGIAIALVAGSITVFGISPQPLIAILTSLLG
jgi:NADH:ubiquinone oxidoreductase subunit 2 (subunit N)